MTSTSWTDGYRDAKAGNAYTPPEHSATSVFTAEYQRGYNAYYDERAAGYLRQRRVLTCPHGVVGRCERCFELARIMARCGVR